MTFQCSNKHENPAFQVGIISVIQLNKFNLPGNWGT